MRYLYVVVGLLCVALGAIGALIPILPTTPFLLVSLWCFTRSSQRLKEWLLTNRYVGSYLSNYMSGRGVPMRVKVYAISTLWVTILCSMIFATENIYVRVGLLVIAVLVTIHLLRLKRYRENE